MMLMAAAPVRAEPEASDATSLSPVATDTALLEMVRAVADATVGEKLGDGSPADKIIYLGMKEGGILVVTGIAVRYPDQPINPPAGCIAAIRVRNPKYRAITPGSGDSAEADRVGIPLFLRGEWSSSPNLWEIAKWDGNIMLRTIDAEAKPGGWAPWTARR